MDEGQSLGLVEAVRCGDRLEALTAIRDKLATLLADADHKAAPALAQRLLAVMEKIDSLSGGEEESVIGSLQDDLAAKRVLRQAAAGP
jgi:hypothetical protein